MLRKQAEVELRAAKAVAERASAARARFLATLTHELRTPLNAVVGYSEMMVPGSRYNPTLEDRGRYSALILDAAQYLLKLADGILDYSYLEQALPSLAPEWLAADQVLANTVALASGESHGRGVEIRMTPVDPALELCIDPVRFRQVLHNLLGNAVKFSQPGSLVEVSAEQMATAPRRYWSATPASACGRRIFPGPGAFPATRPALGPCARRRGSRPADRQAAAGSAWRRADDREPAWGRNDRDGPAAGRTGARADRQLGQDAADRIGRIGSAGNADRPHRRPRPGTWSPVRAGSG